MAQKPFCKLTKSQMRAVLQSRVDELQLELWEAFRKKSYCNRIKRSDLMIANRRLSHIANKLQLKVR